MDPDVLLSQLRELIIDWAIAEDVKDFVDVGGKLAIKFQDLDEWLSGGGFKPLAWSKAY